MEERFEYKLNPAHISAGLRRHICRAPRGDIDLDARVNRSGIPAAMPNNSRTSVSVLHQLSAEQEYVRNRPDRTSPPRVPECKVGGGGWCFGTEFHTFMGHVSSAADFTALHELKKHFGLRIPIHMTTFTKLDETVTRLLCCSFCKGPLKVEPSQFVCRNCGIRYPIVEAPWGPTYDFRLNRPEYLIPQTEKKWIEIQQIYLGYDDKVAERDSLKELEDQINSVREIYSNEFHLTGSVLDVGGHVGGLRCSLSLDEVPIYVSVDPIIDVFRHVQRTKLLPPALAAPCNFLSCLGENLPFIAKSFDWVHMRSVVDHFGDPYLAFREAYRVLKDGGQVLVGLKIDERVVVSGKDMLRRISQKFQAAGVLPTLKEIAGKLTHAVRPNLDDHNFRLKYSELLDLISTSGFKVVKEHWQKPPYSYVIFVSARKISVE
jgi:SAM-dependent methyltransferase